MSSKGEETEKIHINKIGYEIIKYIASHFNENSDI